MRYRISTDQIILHCSATPEGRQITVDQVKEWHLHRGWHDIGYHYVIDLDGVVHEGRDIHKQGAHCRGQNYNSIGICYIGGLSREMEPKDTMTQEQMSGLYQITHQLRAIFGGLPIFGHNEFSEKACPSFDVIEKFGAFCKRTI